MVQGCACWVIRRTGFNVHICLNHNSRYRQNKLEKCCEKPKIKRQFFQNLDNFHIYVFSLTAKVPYLQLLLNILYQSFIAIVTEVVTFLLFLRDYNLFCNKKLFNFCLALCIYFLQKPVKMILKNHSLNLSGQHMISYISYFYISYFCKSSTLG